VISVRGSLSFWIESDRLPDDDYRKAEVRELGFQLVEQGEGHPDARPNRWPFGLKEVDGFSVDLPSKTGFIACAGLTDPQGGSFIGMLYLIWAPQEAPD
jgi:hypothetical protein